MLTFSKLSWELFKKQLKAGMLGYVIQLGLILLATIYMWFSGDGTSSGTVNTGIFGVRSFWGCLIILFWLLIRYDRIYRRNTYQLLPIKNVYLYLANVIATVLAGILILAIESISILGMFALELTADELQHFIELPFTEILLVIGTIIAAGLFIITLTSTISFIYEFIKNLLVRGSRKWFEFFLMWVSIVGVMYVIGKLFSWLNSIYLASTTVMLSGQLLLATVILTVVNLYLYDKWVEPDIIN